MFYDVPSTYSSFFQNWNNLFNEGINLSSNYWLAYYNTAKSINYYRYIFNNTEKTKKDNSSISTVSFPNIKEVIDISNSECNKVLRSRDFVSYFNNHIRTIVKLNSIQRLSFLFPVVSSSDYAIDNSLAFLDTFVKLNETPYNSTAN